MVCFSPIHKGSLFVYVDLVPPKILLVQKSQLTLIASKFVPDFVVLLNMVVKLFFGDNFIADWT